MNGPKHNRKFVIGIVGLTMERPRKGEGIIATKIRDDFEKKLIENNFFDGLPFQWIAINILYGIKDGLPIFDELDKKIVHCL